MRKWVLYGIEPLIPAVDQPPSHCLPVAVPRRTSLLSGVFTWAARSWKWPASLWAKSGVVATVGDICDSADGITVDHQQASHALTQGSISGTPSSHAVAPDLLQQSISNSNVDRVILHDMNGDLAEIQAVHAEALAPPKTHLCPQRRFTWSGKFIKAFNPATDTDESELDVTISCSGDILVNPKHQLQRASTWPRASSACSALAQTLPALAPRFSEPDLAISDNGGTSLASCTPQDHLTPHTASPQSAGSVADTSQAASDQHFHRTYVVKAGQVGGDGIEEIKGPTSSEAVRGNSPRIAAVQSQLLQLQEDKEEVKPQWKVKVDARRAKARQHKDRAGDPLLSRSSVYSLESGNEHSWVHHGFLLLLY